MGLTWLSSSATRAWALSSAAWQPDASSWSWAAGAPCLVSCCKPGAENSAYKDGERRSRPFRISGFVVRPSASKRRHLPYLQLRGSLDMCPGCRNLRRHRDALREVKPWGEHLLLAWKRRSISSLLQYHPHPLPSPIPVLAWVPSPQVTLGSPHPRHKHAALFLLWGQNQG